MTYGKLFAGVACAGLILTSTLSSNAAELTLDDYTGPNFALHVPDSSDLSVKTASDSQTLDLNGAALDISTNRDVLLDATAGGTASVSILSHAPGILAFDTGATANNVVLTLTYDDLNDFDLPAAGSFTHFDLLFPFVDHTANVTVTFDDGAASGSKTLGIGAAGDLLFALGDAAYAGVNFASLDSIEVKIQSTSPATDLILDRAFFTDIPEPGTMALLAMGGAVIACRRRRQA